MQIDIERDDLIVLWRHLEKQPLTEADRSELEVIAAKLYDTLTFPVSADTPKKIGRPRGSKNKQPEPLFPKDQLGIPPDDDLTDKYRSEAKNGGSAA